MNEEKAKNGKLKTPALASVGHIMEYNESTFTQIFSKDLLKQLEAEAQDYIAKTSRIFQRYETLLKQQSEQGIGFSGDRASLIESPHPELF